jgi:hypothetical protein
MIKPAGGEMLDNQKKLSKKSFVFADRELFLPAYYRAGVSGIIPEPGD